MNIDFRLFLYLMVICALSNGQYFISADPFNLFIYEQEKYLGNDHQKSFLLRPLLNQSNNSRWSLVARNEIFINNNGPNLENMGNRWSGKGIGYFTGLNVSFLNKYKIFVLKKTNRLNFNSMRKFGISKNIIRKIILDEVKNDFRLQLKN